MIRLSLCLGLSDASRDAQPYFWISHVAPQSLSPNAITSIRPSALDEIQPIW